MAKRRGSPRNSIDGGRNKMDGRRGEKGRFKEMDHVGRSLAVIAGAAKTTSTPGRGDLGDPKR